MLTHEKYAIFSLWVAVLTSGSLYGSEAAKDTNSSPVTPVAQTGSWMEQTGKELMEHPRPGDVLHVRIDLKPLSPSQLIKLKEDKAVAVAILGSRQLPANKIDESTITLEGAIKGARFRIVDVNLDGYADLVADFPTGSLAEYHGDKILKIRGKTKDGQPFEGEALIAFEREK